jgi:hypothetical protein
MIILRIMHPLSDFMYGLFIKKRQIKNTGDKNTQTIEYK